MSDADTAVHAHSPAHEKIALFRSLFRGREDVYARRFESKKTGRSGYVAYRRDRRKDQLLQENGYFVLRFLAEDLSKDLGHVLDTILRVLTSRERAERGGS